MGVGLRNWSDVAATNESISGSSGAINWKEGQAPSTVNNSAREMMAQIRSHMETAEWFDYGDVVAQKSATTLSLTGTHTATYAVGRRIRISQASGTLYGTITEQTLTGGATVVTVQVDDGSSISGTVSEVALGILSPTNPSLPAWMNGPGNENLCMDGAMQIADEGTQTGQGGSSDYSALTLWDLRSSGSPQGRATTSQDTTVPAGSGLGYTFKIDCTTAEGAVAAGEFIIAVHKMEAQNLQKIKCGSSDAHQLRCNFYFRSPKTGTHCVAFYQADGNRSFIREFTIHTADTLEFKSVTIPGDPSGTINNDTGEGLRVVFPLVCGSTYQASADAWAAGEDYATSNQQNLLDNTANNVYIGGVDLYIDTGVRPYPFEEIGKVVHRSRRHYERHAPSAANAKFPCVGYHWLTLWSGCLCL